ncbi:MAG TPA: M24 family metallopeptidase [Acidimicrobiia bacterium]|jgi:Xaa-Pro aminopeptidase
MNTRGTMVLEEGSRIDFDALRLDRRARVRAMMDEHDIDVLMCIRQGNARYVTGHRPLWRAVITPWAPMCTFVRATGGIHLLAATWDDGIPGDIPHENLFALTWNASNTVNSIAGIEGLADARVIAVDGMSPGLAKLLGMLAPNARLVDGEALMRDVRAVKLPAEIECLRTAIAIAEGALATVTTELRPGVRELELKGAFEAAVCGYGLNHVAYEGTFCAAPRDAGSDAGAQVLRRIPTERPIGAGELVVLHGAVHYAGYEGIAGRTRPCVGPSGMVNSTASRGQRELARRFIAAQASAIDACGPGAPANAVATAWARHEAVPLDAPLLYGIGLGVEGPLVGGVPEAAAEDASLRPGMVVVVQGSVHEPGVGTYFGADVVAISDDGPRRLSRASHAPLDVPTDALVPA